MKTKSLYLLLVFLMMNVSCDKFLEEELVSDTSANAYYINAAGIEDAVDGAYGFLKFVYSNERAHTLTIFGTDTYTNGADGNHKAFNFYDSNLNSASDMLREMWQNLYRGVNQCNAVIGRIGAIPDMPDATKVIRVGEMKFLRALYYFNLVRQWGGVPLILEETTFDNFESRLSIQPSDESAIYAAIIADLEEALPALPATQTNYGRATSGAVQNLLGLVHLTRAYKSYAVANDFVTAEGYFTDVIGNTNYALAPDMANLWNQDNQKNKEIIFAVQYSTDAITNGGEGNRAHLYFLMEYDIRPGMERDIANGRPFKRFRPTDYLLGLWEADREIDNRYDQTYKHVWYCNDANAPFSIPKWEQKHVDAGAKKADGSLVLAGDIGTNRFAVGDTALFIPGPGRDAEWTANGGLKKNQVRYTVYTKSDYSERIFAHIEKFTDPRRPTIQWEQGSRDWFVMRLGDTYLLRAEARFNQGNLTGAADDINVIRTRAAKPGKILDMQITALDVTMDFILDERARELDAEQCRWYDLTRTGTLITRVNALNPQAGGRVDEHFTRRPVPQIQIDRTLGGYPQNCGYPGADPCN
jgi:starch-binding outer membrane protein, SusD/RagB family